MYALKSMFSPSQILDQTKNDKEASHFLSFRDSLTQPRWKLVHSWNFAQTVWKVPTSIKPNALT